MAKSSVRPVWETMLSNAIGAMLRQENVLNSIDIRHLDDTPDRVVKSFKEMFAGCNENPKDALSTLFVSKSDQMIHIKDITFYSMCAHHLLTFYGTCSFAYIPNGTIVGLSKVPRLVEVYARRPQVQEQLTSQIVQSFQDIVKPLGCGLVMRAYHLCCMARGVRQPTSYTETTELAGTFREPSVKAEFLKSVQSNVPVWR